MGFIKKSLFRNAKYTHGNNTHIFSYSDLSISYNSNLVSGNKGGNSFLFERLPIISTSLPIERENQANLPILKVIEWDNNLCNSLTIRQLLSPEKPSKDGIFSDNCCFSGLQHPHKAETKQTHK